MPPHSHIPSFNPTSLLLLQEKVAAPEQPAPPPTSPSTQPTNPIERLRLRLSTWLKNGRPLTFTYGIPGTGRGMSRALRPGLPVYPPASEAEPSLDELLKEITAFKATVDTLTQGLDVPGGKIWQRPAPSMPGRMATCVAPWLKPDSLESLTRYQRPDDPRHPKQRGAPIAHTSTQPWEQSLAALCEQAQTQREVLDRAIEGLDAAMAACEKASTPIGASEPGQGDPLAPAQQRLARAHGDLITARQGMKTLLLDSRLQAIRTQHVEESGEHQRNAFQLTRINDLRRQGEALKGTLVDRGAAVGYDLALAAEHTRLLLDTDRALKQAEMAEAQAHYHLQQVRASAEPDDPLVEQARAQVHQTTQQTQRVEASFHEAVIQLRSLNTEMGEGLERLAEQRRLHTQVEQRQAALGDAEQQLRTQPAASFDSAASQQAMDAADSLFARYAREVTQPFADQHEPRLDAALARFTEHRAEAAALPPIPEVLLTAVVTDALHAVTGSALQAAQVLDAIGRHPLPHWLDDAHSAATKTVPEARENVRALCRVLAPLPRGMDILHLLSSERSKLADPGHSQALLVYWSAEQARLDQRRDEKPLSATELSVDAWLGSAQAVASERLRGGDDSRAEDVSVAAFHAVANGYVSNAPGSPYDTHDQRLRKASVQWLARAMADRAAGASETDSPSGSRLRRLVPHLGKTPFKAKTLKRGHDVGESMGMNTARKAVDDAIDRRLSDLQHLAKGIRAADPDTADGVEAVIAYLASLKAGGAHLSHHQFGPKAADKVARRLGALHHERRLKARADGRDPHVGTLIKAHTKPVLPEPYASLCASQGSVFEVLECIDEHLRASLPADRAVARTPDPEGLLQAAALLKRKYLGSKQDIVAFFTPLILGCQLRQRLRLGGGGTLGGGLPSLPYSVVSPVVSPMFSAELSRTDEAFVQLFMPSFGMEMTFGSTRTHAGEMTGGVAAGPAVSAGVSLQGVLSGRYSRQKTRTDGTLLRFLRTRHKDEEMRQSMVNMFDSLVRWDQIPSQRGRQFAGPMEAILARNPKVSISELTTTVSTQTLTARLGGRLPGGVLNDGRGVGQSLSLEPSLYVEAERVRDQRQEIQGHIRVDGQRGDTAQQRAGVTLNFNAQPISNQPVSLNNHGGTTRQGLGGQVGVSREVAWALERHEITSFLMSGNKQDADLDRHYTSVKDMLKEINDNRDLWLMRCIETLEPDANGEKNTLANRVRATELLQQFEKTITVLAKHNRYCVYNLNYSMKGALSGTLDGYRALTTLANRRGDHKIAEQAQAAFDQALLMEGTWRPSILIVRERARDAEQRGWRGPLRWQRVASVEGQRTAAQYPPP